MTTNVVTLFESNFREVAPALRKLADEVERGDFGDVKVCAVSLSADELHVFGSGPAAEGPSTAMTLHAGFVKLSRILTE